MWELLKTIATIMAMGGTLFLFVYLMLPEHKSLTGKCFYYPSPAANREMQRGEFSYIEITGRTAFKYKAKNTNLAFNNESGQILGKETPRQKTYLFHRFHQSGYIEIECPGGRGELIPFGQHK